MFAWRRSHTVLSQAFLGLPSVLNFPSPSLSPTYISDFLLGRGHHGPARLEDIPEGSLPLGAYNELVKSGLIRYDQGQVTALQPLERLHMELENYVPPSVNLVSKMLSYISLKPRRQIPRGVYIHGGVGSGKSLVADIFFHCSPIESKQRVHFHKFMLDVHKRLHRRRLMGDCGKNIDIIEEVAGDLLQEGWLLCFDEFQVYDIADAMILRRLLERIFKAGAVMVASSNRAPNELYKNGLQRELFLPCIELIQDCCQVFPFRNNAPDYRLIGARPDGSGTLSTVWHMPLNKETNKKLEQLFAKLAGDRMVGPTVITEGPRTIFVPRAAGGGAIFTFAEICGTPKGASDYLAIAASFHTLFVSDIPKMTWSHGELARRFIILVDILYEQRVKLIVSADAHPAALYRPRQEEEEIGPLGSVKKTEAPSSSSSGSAYEEQDEEFAFARTVSRLNHMQSADYLSAPWAPPGKAFMVHLASVKLKEGDLRRIWDRYNTDNDTKLDRQELLLMMEDLTEIKSGHRNVMPELVDDMYEKLDANHDGIVIWEEFRDYFLRYGLQ